MEKDFNCDDSEFSHKLSGVDYDDPRSQGKSGDMESGINQFVSF